MKKRKSGSTTFWVTFCLTATISGLAPAVAQSDNLSPPASTFPTDLKTDPATKTDPSAPSPVKYLTLADLKPLIPDLKITVDSDGKGGQAATLRGSYPSECQNFKILTSSQGFSIRDQGGFLSCVAGWEKAGNVCDDTTVCSHLSTSSAANGSSLIDCRSRAFVSYQNYNNGDMKASDRWSASDLKSDTECSSKADIDEAALEAQDAATAKKIAALQQEILSCAKSSNTIGTARDLLQNKSLDSATVSELEAKIDAYQKQFDDKDAKALVAKVKLGVSKGKIDDFDDYEDQVYDYLDKSPGEGDKMVPLIFAMAQARTTADGADDDSINRAADMINRALDPDTGITMKAANRKILEAAVATGGGIDQARLQIAYQNYESIRDKKGEYQMTPFGMMKVSATDKAEKRYQALVKAMDKDLAADLKSMGCKGKNGLDSAKRDTDTALDKSCNDLESREQALADIPNEMEVAHQQDLATTQQAAVAQQAAAMSALGQRQYIMGANGQMLPQQTGQAGIMGQQNGMQMINPTMNFAPQSMYGQQQLGAPQYVPATSAGVYNQYSAVGAPATLGGYNGYYMGGQPTYYHN